MVPPRVVKTPSTQAPLSIPYAPQQSLFIQVYMSWICHVFPQEVEIDPSVEGGGVTGVVEFSQLYLYSSK